MLKKPQGMFDACPSKARLPWHTKRWHMVWVKIFLTLKKNLDKYDSEDILNYLIRYLIRFSQ